MPFPSLEKKPVIIGGASRSEIAPRYDLILPGFLRSFALRMGHGAEKHGENDYQHGDSRYIIETENHLADHLAKHRLGDASDDHLIAIACNAMILWWHRDNAKGERA